MPCEVRGDRRPRPPRLIDHGFEVRRRAGSLNGDVFIGEVSPTAGFVPSPWLLPGTTARRAHQVFADAPAAFTGASMTLELARPNAPVFEACRSLKDSTDPRRRVAMATLAIGSLMRASIW
jgi:hypothetical protein